MTFKRTFLTTAAASVLLGSLGLVTFTLAKPVLANTRLAQQSNQPSQGQGQGNRPNQCQGQGNRPNQGQGQGNRPGQGQGSPEGCQGRGSRGQHLATAATQLGVTEAELKAALGVPTERPERPDLAAAATQLGTTEAELRASMRSAMQEQRQSQGQGQGHRHGPPDFTAVAQQYGVSEAEFRAILGIPDRPDLAAAATQLGVTEAELRNALQSAHGGRGPGGAGMR
jgi:hypothetical protein